MIWGVSNTNWSLESDMQRSSRLGGYKSGASRVRSSAVPQ